MISFKFTVQTSRRFSVRLSIYENSANFLTKYNYTLSKKLNMCQMQFNVILYKLILNKYKQIICQ